jgi:S1-C subfamily serine protease
MQKLVVLSIAISGISVATAPVLAQNGGTQRQGLTFCVTPPDSNWRPVSFGFDTENRGTVRDGNAMTIGYPVIRNVARGSVADSAGIRDGDVWRAVDGHDFVRDREHARVHGPGVPVRLTIARGDSVFDRVVTPGPAPRSLCNK